MSDCVELKGMIVRTSPVKEYDKRVVILTGESGRITAFARGARRQGSKLLGTTEPFCFGTFKLFPGRDAYTVADCSITRFFEELRSDYDAYAYATYFLEIAEYYTKENLEAYDELNLIYASLLALISGRFDKSFIRSVYEIRSLVIAGEFPGLPDNSTCRDTVVYAVDRIASSPLESLYSFGLTGEALKELVYVSRHLFDRICGHSFKSLSMIDSELPA